MRFTCSWNVEPGVAFILSTADVLGSCVTDISNSTIWQRPSCSNDRYIATILVSLPPVISVPPLQLRGAGSNLLEDCVFLRETTGKC